MGILKTATSLLPENIQLKIVPANASRIYYVLPFITSTAKISRGVIITTKWLICSPKRMLIKERHTSNANVISKSSNAVPAVFFK